MGARILRQESAAAGYAAEVNSSPSSPMHTSRTADERKITRLRQSSLEEYASWYLAREAKKPGAAPVAAVGPAAVTCMWQQHPGKMRGWFRNAATWSVVTLNSFAEVERLIFLESSWTKEEQLVIPDGAPNYRLLDRVAQNASMHSYFDRPRADRHRVYRDDLCTGRLSLVGDSRIALCTPEESEIRTNPAGTFYILDGVGRCLPFVTLVRSGGLIFTPVEAFLVERSVSL